MQALFRSFDPIEHPPLLPIPTMAGHDTNSEGRDSTQLTMSLSTGGLADYTFTAFCQSWILVGEVLLVYQGPNSQRDATLVFALMKYQKILYWADSLPALMERNKTAASHVWVFQ